MDISLIQFVIPGLTKPAPYLIRGNPVFFWIPAFAGMTAIAMINVAVYRLLRKSIDTEEGRWQEILYEELAGHKPSRPKRA